MTAATAAKKTGKKEEAAVPRPGRGNKRPADLPAAARALLDDQASRAAARRQALRDNAATGPFAGVSTFGQRLAAARAMRGYTQAQVGKHVGVTRTAVALWEIGDPGARTVPHTSRIQMLADFLNVPMTFLLDDKADPTTVYVYAKGASGVTSPAMPTDILNRLQQLESKLGSPGTAPGLSDLAIQLGQALDRETDPTKRKALFMDVAAYLEFKRAAP